MSSKINLDFDRRPLDPHRNFTSDMTGSAIMTQQDSKDPRARKPS